MPSVIHVDKGKKAAGSRYLGNHIDRTEPKGKEAKNVDRSRCHLNFDLVDASLPLAKTINKRLKESGVKTRSNSVEYVKVILSGGHEEMKKLEKEGRIEEWARDSYQFMAKKFGAQNIMRFTVHLDEKTPHAHCVFTPITKDNRLSARDLIGGDRKAGKLKQLHTAYAKEVQVKYGIQRGLENSKVENHKKPKAKSLNDYYREFNVRTVKAEDLIPTNFIGAVQKDETVQVIARLLQEQETLSNSLKIARNSMQRSQVHLHQSKKHSETAKKNYQAYVKLAKALLKDPANAKKFIAKSVIEQIRKEEQEQKKLTQQQKRKPNKGM